MLIVDRKEESLKDKIKSFLQHYVESYFADIVLIEAQSDQLVENLPVNNTSVSIMQSMSMNNAASLINGTLTSCYVSLCGTIHCIAFYTKDSSLQFVVNQLRKDLVKTIKDRFELIMEQYDKQGDKSLQFIKLEQKVIDVELPVRVYFKDNDIQFCDYIIIDKESLNDSLNRFSSLLGIQGDKELIVSPEQHNLLERESEIPTALEQRKEKTGFLAWIYSLLMVLLSLFTIKK